MANVFLGNLLVLPTTIAWLEVRRPAGACLPACRPDAAVASPGTGGSARWPTPVHATLLPAQFMDGVGLFDMNAGPTNVCKCQTCS